MDQKTIYLWKLGITALFRHLQRKRGLNECSAWALLKKEVYKIDPVCKHSSLRIVEQVLLEDYTPSIEEAVEMSKAYPSETPVLDAFNTLLVDM